MPETTPAQGTTEPGTEKPNDQGGTSQGNQGAGTSILDGDAQAGGREGEPKGQNAGADEYASVKLPEGAEVDEQFFGDVKVWAKESGVKADGLQKLVDRWGKRIAEVNKQQEQEFKSQRTKQVQGWVKELEGDKEFGGKNFKDNVAGLQKFLSKVDADRSFRKALVQAGVDNWPPLVRFLHALSKSNKDDSVAGTLDGIPKNAATDDQAFYGELYPSMKKGA